VTVKFVLVPFSEAFSYLIIMSPIDVCKVTTMFMKVLFLQHAALVPFQLLDSSLTVLLL
jgi:hypothetical protein